MTNIASDWVGAGRRRLIKDAHISKKNLKSKQGVIIDKVIIVALYLIARIYIKA